MPVTIRDVAKAAGVSAMSVSKVLHGRGTNVRVSEETAALIRRTAEEMAYRPNALARSFRQGRTKTLGLVWDSTPDLSGDTRYFSDLLDSAVKAAFARGYSVTLCPSLVGEGTDEAQADGRFDGVLLCRGFGADGANPVGRVPTVMFHLPPPGAERLVDHVCWDNEAAVGQVVGHLAALGHRNLAFASDDRFGGTTELARRREIFVEACKGAGLGLDLLAWSDVADGFPHWWAKRPGATALVCWSEQMALGVLRVATGLGVEIPRELSVAGFDSTAQSEMSFPRLTCARQPLRDMAARAIAMLVDRIEHGERAPESVVFPSVLDVRESTAAPRR
ncbi:LacI family DNA-binding transcriptional regulator [soil metagenome]